MGLIKSQKVNYGGDGHKKYSTEMRVLGFGVWDVGLGFMWGGGGGEWLQ